MLGSVKSWFGKSLFGVRDVNRADGLIALLLSVFAICLRAERTHPSHPHGGFWASLAVLSMTVPVLWRRRAPLGAVATLAAGALFNGLVIGSMVRCGAALPALALVMLLGRPALRAAPGARGRRAGDHRGRGSGAVRPETHVRVQHSGLGAAAGAVGRGTARALARGHGREPARAHPRAGRATRAHSATGRRGGARARRRGCRRPAAGAHRRAGRTKRRVDAGRSTSSPSSLARRCPRSSTRAAGRLRICARS